MRCSNCARGHGCLHSACRHAAQRPPMQARPLQLACHWEAAATATAAPPLCNIAPCFPQCCAVRWYDLKGQEHEVVGRDFKFSSYKKVGRGE